MSDLREMLHEMSDDTGAPRGASEVFTRASVAASSRRRRRTVQRSVAGVLALTVIVGAVVVVASHRTTTHDIHVVTPAPPTVPGTVPVADLRDGHWDLLPPAPIPPGGESVWTGHELLVWGGAYGKDDDTLSAAGAAYNPTSRTWRVLAPAPISARSGFAIVWTGHEMLVWGGYTDARNGAKTDDGAAYDPTTNSWRLLPQAPLPAQAALVAVWTGNRALFLSDADDGAALYDPATNTWTATARPPGAHGDAQWFQAVARGDGSDVLAWLHWNVTVKTGPDSTSGTEGIEQYAYDASENRWSAGRDVTNDSGAIPNVMAAFWTGHGVLIRGDTRICWLCTGPGPLAESSAYYDATSGTWTPLPPDPLAPTPIGADNLSSVWTGNALFSFNRGTEIGGSGASFQLEPGDASLFDAATNSWTRLPSAPAGCDADTGTPAWTGHEILLYCQPTTRARTALHASGLAWIPGSPASVAGRICGNPPPPNVSAAHVSATIHSPLARPTITITNGSGAPLSIGGGSGESLYLVDSNGNVVSVGMSDLMFTLGTVDPGHGLTMKPLPPSPLACISFSAGSGESLPAGNYRAIGLITVDNVSYSTDAVPVTVGTDGKLHYPPG